MPQVTTRYRVIVTTGHHRQPRNGPAWAEPYPTIANSNAVPGSQGQAFAPPTIPYPPNSQTHADFLFWSAGDGTNGQTGTDPTFSYTVGNDPLTVVAWYLPEGGGVGDQTGYVIDAFSDALNDFVDDDFVSVSPDAGLTSDANVVGWVPTDNGETLTAVPGSIHTGEAFESWIGGHPVANTATDQLAQQASGYAVATYRRQNVPVPSNVGQKELLVWLILFGIINDAPGVEVHPGGGGGPVGPWGPYLERVARAAAVASVGIRMAGGAEITRVALAEVQAATKQLQVDAGIAGKQHQG